MFDTTSVVANHISRLCYISVCMAGSITLLNFSAASGSDVGPSSDNLRAYSLGQSYQRSFQDYLMPGTCGIVLERQRCRDDFAAIRQFFGNQKMDDQVARWLQDGDLDHQLRDWDGIRIPDVGWKNGPAFVWWYTAGTLSISAEMPKNDADTNYVSDIVDLLAKHDNVAPKQFKGMITAGGSPYLRVKSLLDALNAAIPPTAFPAVSLATGDTGYAQLGVLSSTLQELIDNPLALSRPESRLFALAVIDQFDAFVRKLGGSYSFDDVRQRLRGDIPSDANQIDTELRQPLSTWASPLKRAPTQRDAFLFGTMTAQAAYNAAILKDEKADSGYLRGTIADTKYYAGMSSAAKSAVHKMQYVPYGDWPNIDAAACAATLAIMGP